MRRFTNILTIVGCIFSISVFTTCIKPLDVEPADFDDFLVVQGFIDDDYGPHKIRITNVAKFTGSRGGGGVLIVDQAVVRIIDQDEVVTDLERLTVVEKRRAGGRCGFEVVEVLTDYQTPSDFKGEISNTYTLEIVTKEDKIYRSEPQTIVPTPAIDSILLAFKELPSLDPIMPASAVEVFSRWQDPINEENFYFWRINGIYKIFTPDLSDEIRCCPYDPIDGGAKDCWIIEDNIIGNETAFSDFQVDGQLVTQPVGLIEDDGFRFSDRFFLPPDKLYHVEVEQYMVPEEAFLFNEKVKILSEINGEIFDPPPLEVRGNIFNVSDSGERVIGYFGAYDKQTAETFIPKSLLKFIQFFPNPCGDCRTRSGAQTEIPEPYK